MEQRCVQIEGMEVRAAGDNQRILTGTAVVYGQTTDMGFFFERIQPGALTDVLAADDNIAVLYEHDRRSLLASLQGKSLTLTDTPKGLNFRMDVAETSIGNDVLALVKRGELKGMSFAFRVAENGQQFADEGGKTVRVITKIDMMPEITITAWPAYGDTKVNTRSIDPEAIELAKALKDRKPIDEYRSRLRRLIAQ